MEHVTHLEAVKTTEMYHLTGTVVRELNAKHDMRRGGRIQDRRRNQENAPWTGKVHQVQLKQSPPGCPVRACYRDVVACSPLLFDPSLLCFSLILVLIIVILVYFHNSTHIHRAWIDSVVQ
jgi:hypothetical protein